VFQDLVEDLGGREAVDEVGGHHGHHAVVGLGPAPVPGHRLRHRSALLLLEVAAVAHDVVEQPPCLVLGDLEPGEHEQPVPVAPGFGHPRADAEAGAFGGGDELELVDVEAELV